ncbi:hypothetical protein VC82_2793 [Flagellimonas lutaonensis]|uniref:Uncharacterized protein n=1 Tax=Flagellimonas lutaonensis TaxID=516051 RepID=A0A0D5YVT6_9FLAO|nr:hypothetical protein VC82_2793 [Allomuricauda lutaonensis]
MVAERSRSKLKRALSFDQDPFTRTLYENEKIYFLNQLHGKCTPVPLRGEIIVVKCPFSVVCA